MQESLSLKQRLVKCTFGLFGLKIITTGLAFLLNILLARTLGPEGLGTYALLIAWIGFLGLPAKLGFHQLLIREVAIYSSNEQWSLLKGILKRSYQIVASLSIALIILVSSATWQLNTDSQIHSTLLISLIALPFISIEKLSQSAMVGLHKVIQGQIPQSLFSPCLMLTLTLICHIFARDNLTPKLVITCYVFVAATTALISLFQLIHALPNRILKIQPEFDHTAREWIKKSLPFMILGALCMINNQTDIVMLGVLQGDESVGLYIGPSKLASLVTFIILARNSAIGPNIASLYASGKKYQLEKLVMQSSKIILSISCVLAVFILFFNDFLLGLFGKEFLVGKSILILLLLGHIMTALAGPVGILLNMSGNEKISLLAFSLSAILNICLNYYLIPHGGGEGAAVATTISLATWNLVCVILVLKTLRINPTAFGKAKSQDYILN